MSDKPFEFIQSMTRQHRADHGCGAYTFEDGPGLTALAATHRASRVLELGTALGYTGCCLAAAASNTNVDSIEMDAEHVRLARENIARAGLSDRVRVHQGDFMAITERLPGNYDLAFFDGFAPEVRILRLLRKKLRDGGLLVCAKLSFAHEDSKAELNNVARWRPAGSIEGGGTRAFVKNAQAAMQGRQLRQDDCATGLMATCMRPFIEAATRPPEGTNPDAGEAAAPPVPRVQRDKWLSLVTVFITAKWPELDAQVVTVTAVRARHQARARREEMAVERRQLRRYQENDKRRCLAAKATSQPDAAEIIDRGGKIVAIYAQKDNVARGHNLSCSYCLGPNGEIPIRWADNSQPLGLDLLGSLWTNEKGQVTACLCETSAKIATNWANRPQPFKIYPKIKPLPLPRDVPQTGVAALSAISEPVLSSRTDSVPDLQDLARVLYFSAGITKQRAHLGGEICFRAAACTGALYEIELYVVTCDLVGLNAGVYHFNPADLSFRLLRKGDFRGNLAQATAMEPAVAHAPATIICTGTYWRNAWKYQARTYRHFGWDNGTLLANMLAVSVASGLHAEIVLGFVDGELNRLLDLDTRREVSLCLVPIGRKSESSPLAPRETPALGLETTPLSEREVEYPAMLEMHQASSLEFEEEVAQIAASRWLVKQ